MKVTEFKELEPTPARLPTQALYTIVMAILALIIFALAYLGMSELTAGVYAAMVAQGRDLSNPGLVLLGQLITISPGIVLVGILLYVYINGQDPTGGGMP